MNVMDVKASRMLADAMLDSLKDSLPYDLPLDLQLALRLLVDGHTKKVYVARNVQFRRLLPICSGASSGSTFLVSKDSRNGTVPRKQKHPRFLRMRYLRYSKKLRFYSDVHLGLFVRQNGGL